MTVYKGQHLSIGAPVSGAATVRTAADPDDLRALVTRLRTAQDRARHGVTQAFTAREQAGTVEQRMHAALRGSKAVPRA